MYRSEQVGFGKRSRLIADLTAQIRSGRLARGDRLPGENQLARQYEVSRGTVRSALAELAQRQLITTQSGVGSFVTFGGVALDRSLGWATALARSGFEITTTLLGIERATDPALSEAYEVAELIEVRRLRRQRAGAPLSLEVSLVAATGLLADLPERGLVNDSLTATLASAGLRASSGEQWIGLQALDAEAAALLEREAGQPFLRAVRISTDAHGRLVEHVVSLLDPAHFRFHLTLGER
jgi:GntR family transcriptional regulator